jgi:hypothetical protein
MIFKISYPGMIEKNGNSYHNLYRLRKIVEVTMFKRQSRFKKTYMYERIKKIKQKKGDLK